MTALMLAQPVESLCGVCGKALLEPVEASGYRLEAASAGPVEVHGALSQKLFAI